MRLHPDGTARAGFWAAASCTLAALGLSVAAPSEAAPVYTLANAEVNAPVGGGFDSYLLDMDADGAAELRLLNIVDSGDETGHVTGFGFNGYFRQGFGLAADLAFGTAIGPGMTAGSAWEKGTGDMWLAINGSPLVTPWTEPAYLGVRFERPTGTHYGWAQIEVVDNDGALFLYDYAYESEPDTTLLAGVPEPSTLLLLSAGLIALGGGRGASR